MNVSDTLQKLVNLLGHSENDPELQRLFIALGEKFPLKRPKADDNGGYLLEDSKKKNRGYHLGVHYAEELPLSECSEVYKEGELVFYNIQNIIDKKKFKDVTFPFGITWDVTPKQVSETLGNYFNFHNGSMDDTYYWRKNGIVIMLSFIDNHLVELSYRVLIDYDLKYFN